MVHFLRHGDNQTIVDLEAWKEDMSCVVNIREYTAFLNTLSPHDYYLRYAWMEDMFAIQEIREEYWGNYKNNKRYTPDEYAEKRCRELAKKWELAYVTD
jgi:hypothetical protein